MDATLAPAVDRRPVSGRAVTDGLWSIREYRTRPAGVPRPEAGGAAPQAPGGRGAVPVRWRDLRSGRGWCRAGAVPSEGLDVGGPDPRLLPIEGHSRREAGRRPVARRPAGQLLGLV